MAEKTTKVCVRLTQDLHRKIKVRATEEGVSMDSLARGWFTAYAEKKLGRK